MGLLIMLRHGQSQWNLENRFTGWRDVDLTATGEEEAREAGRRLARAEGGALRPDRAYASTLTRAKRTCRLALDTLAAAGADLAHLRRPDGGWAVAEEEVLRERDYGDLSGLNKAETAAKYGDAQVHLWRRSYDVRPPGGESLADVVARVTPFYRATLLPQLAAGETLLVAAHGNSLRALLVALGKYDTAAIPTVEIPTGSPLVCRFEGAAPGALAYLP